MPHRLLGFRTQRRRVLVLLPLVVVVGVALLLVAGEERRRVQGSIPVSVEPSGDEVAEWLEGGFDRPAIDEVEARRALAGSTEGVGSDEAATRGSRVAVGLLTGRVVDERGKPLAGIGVHVVPGVREEDMRENCRTRMQTEPVMTDASGAFRTEVRVGPAWLEVRAPGFAPVVVSRLRVTPSGTAIDDDIVLQPSAIVTGVVLDENGAPLANASVALFEARGLHEHRTGADGTFQFDQLERTSITIFAAHASHAARIIELDASRPFELPFVSLRLSRGDVIEGRLEGFPKAATDAWRVVAHNKYAMRSIRYEDRIASVDEAGFFCLRGLGPGKSWEVFAVPAAKHDGAPAAPTDSTDRVSEVVTADSGERQVVLHWEEGWTVSGRVVDATTREPIPWLDAQCGSRLPWPAERQQDRFCEYPDGRVRFEGLRTDGNRLMWLRIAAVGYESWFRSDIPLEPGKELELGTIELVPAIRMRVSVLDARTEQPVTGALVGWSEQDERRGADYAEALAERGDVSPWRRRSRGYAAHPVVRTDEGGHATFEGTRDCIVELTVMAPGFASAHVTDWKLPSAGDAERVVRLEPGCRVDVLALDAEGRALVGRTIEHRLSGLAGYQRDEPELPVNLDPERSKRVTDAEGRASFDDLAPGTHAFLIEPREDSGAIPYISAEDQELAREAAWSAITVGAEHGALVLTEAPRGALFGRLTEQGRALARARVALFSRFYTGSALYLQDVLERDAKTVSTDAEGRYRIDDVEPGDYVLRILPAGCPSTFDSEVSVPPGETQHYVQLATATLGGRVVDAHGQGVADALVLASVTHDGQARRAHHRQDPSLSFRLRLLGSYDIRTDATGAWEIRGLEAGLALIALAGGGDSDWQPVCSEELTLLPGERRDGVVLVVELGGALVVRFPERKLNGTLVLSPAAGTKGEGRVREIFDRSARISTLAPGAWILDVYPSNTGQPVKGQPFEIVAGKTTEIDIVLAD